MLVISNTTPIISLCSVKKEFILKEMFSVINIPNAVNEELIAKFHKLNVNRTLSILKTAKELGIIKKIKPILFEMIDKGRWYSSALANEFLKSVNE